MNRIEKQLFISEIISPNTKIDRIYEMIFIAEDTGFSIEQSNILSLWLLNFAKKYRNGVNSNHDQNERAVWSAIRTGASMLTLDRLNDLIPLLEADYPVSTTLVTIKMIGRIFEAQPAKEIDQYEEMAKNIYNIVESIIDKKEVSYHREAVAGLSVDALAGMGSSSIKQIIEKIIKNEERWFIQSCLRSLRGLRNEWESNFKIEPHEPLKLLNSSICQLAVYIKKQEVKNER
jgi:hypothetical protein